MKPTGLQPVPFGRSGTRPQDPRSLANAPPLANRRHGNPQPRPRNTAALPTSRAGGPGRAAGEGGAASPALLRARRARPPAQSRDSPTPRHGHTCVAHGTLADTPPRASHREAARRPLQEVLVALTITVLGSGTSAGVPM